MAMETSFSSTPWRFLKKNIKELDMLGVTLPDVRQIPAVRFDKAKELVSENITDGSETLMT